VLNVPHLGSNWIEQTKEQFSLPIINVLSTCSSLDSFLPIHHDTPLSQVVRFFSYGIHRLPVLDSSGELESIVTQYDMLQVLADNLLHYEDLAAMSKKPMTSFMVLPHKVVTVQEDCLLLKAFDTIISNSISGLGVVNKEDQLVGNISATDFQGFTENNLPQLSEQTAKEFIRNQVLISCHRYSTFKDVVELFLKARVHRIYITDLDQHVIGIVTLTDVLKMVMQQILHQA